MSIYHRILAALTLLTLAAPVGAQEICNPTQTTNPGSPIGAVAPFITRQQRWSPVRAIPPNLTIQRGSYSTASANYVPVGPKDFSKIVVRFPDGQEQSIALEPWQSAFYAMTWESLLPDLDVQQWLKGRWVLRSDSESGSILLNSQMSKALKAHRRAAETWDQPWNEEENRKALEALRNAPEAWER